MSLEQTEAECANVAVAPRVSLADIEHSILQVFHTTADDALQTVAVQGLESLAVLSLCVVVMRNGFVVVGKSAPASTKNFNRDLGRKLAYEDAIRQIWPLMGFAPRERLARA